MLSLVLLLGLTLASHVNGFMLPGFIKPNPGYSGNLMIFKANATQMKGLCHLSLTDPTTSRQGTIEWPCKEGADLVMGTYFDRMTRHDQNYALDIFYSESWLGLEEGTQFIGPFPGFKVHLFISKFAHLEERGEVIWVMGDKRSMEIHSRGHFILDGDQVIQLDIPRGTDLQACGAWIR